MLLLFMLFQHSQAHNKFIIRVSIIIIHNHHQCHKILTKGNSDKRKILNNFAEENNEQRRNVTDTIIFKNSIID